MSGFISAGKSPMRYLFIDGAYLRSALDRQSKRYFGGEVIGLDFKKFVHGFNKKFYYDCLPPKKPGESMDAYSERIQPTTEFLDQLRSIDGFHVFLGTTSGVESRSRQKGVDIMISVHMLTHSFRKNCDQMTLLTGDLDFKPLIDSLVQDGMQIGLWYEPASTSKDLSYAADFQRHLDIPSIFSCATDEFLKIHPAPKLWSQSGKVTDGYKKIRSGSTFTGASAELLESSEGLLLITPDKHNAGYFLHIEHSNLELIEKIMSDWKTPIQWS